MLVYDKSLEDDLTKALQLSGYLQDKIAIKPFATLEEQMSYLSHYANQEYIDNTICVLGGDFAPWSFAFAMYALTSAAKEGTLHSAYEITELMKTRDKYLSMFDVLKLYGYKYWFNGGLIFHGSHDGFGSGQAPTFSVCLTPSNGWSVHT